MLDFNHSASFAGKISALINDTLVAENAMPPPRDYLGRSRLRERFLRFCGSPRPNARNPCLTVAFWQMQPAALPGNPRAMPLPRRPSRPESVDLLPADRN